MGVDANLFVNSKVSIRDIRDILENQLEVKELRVETYPSTPDMTVIHFIYGDEQRSLHVHTSAYRGGFHGTLLDLTQWGSASEILQTIAETVGGFMTHSDCGNDWQEVRGKMGTENGIPYFVEHWLLTNRWADVKDLAQLKDTIRQWDERYNNKKSSIKE